MNLLTKKQKKVIEAWVDTNWFEIHKARAPEFSDVDRFYLFADLLSIFQKVNCHVPAILTFIIPWRLLREAVIDYSVEYYNKEYHKLVRYYG